MEKSLIFILALVAGVLLYGFLIYYLVKFCKRHDLGDNKIKVEGDDKIRFLVMTLGMGVLTIASSLGAMYWGGWNMVAGDIVMLIFGSYFFGTGFALLTSSFVLNYYRKDLDEKQYKVNKIVMFSSIGVFILGFYLMTQGFANYLSYPLPNSISFKTGFGYPISGVDYGFTIAFYGIVIVFGALISYFISDHYLYKKFGKHGLIDTLLLVAFPMGLIGARLWYCLVLEPSTYLKDPIQIFNIRDGGMAIMGGAILGIISGVLFILRFRKYIDIRFAMDVIVPTILIAQAIGRVGNFFNQEVYGFVVSADSIAWLPRIIVNNMYINGNYRLPLFLIEAVMNVAGYFIIRYAIAKPLHNKLALGSQAGLYVFWYGMTRVVLEPLREGFTLNPGSSSAFGYMQSWITAFVLVGVGILMVGGAFLWNYLKYRKTGKWMTFENV